MNEILKFKEGRKIGKYQNPAGPLKPSNPWDEYYSQVYTLGGDAFAPTVQRVEAPVRTERTNQGSTNFRERRRMAAQGAYNSQVRAGQRNPAQDVVPVWRQVQKTSDNLTSTNADVPSMILPEHRQDYISRLLGSQTDLEVTKKVIKPRTTPKGQGYWNKLYQDFLGKMTDDLKAWLTQRGIDYNSAEQMLTYLANHGQNLGKWGVDGKWAGASQAAWDNFVATTMKNNPLQTPVKDVPQPVVEPVVDAVDPFGYKTSNHYGNGLALKNMGFSNYTGLQKFAMGNDQFAKDLRERFGQDVNQWDQAAVEGALGVSGRYRGSRGGDFGDMARSMQQWAAKKNAAYDQKELASRTGASGTTYSSPEMMKKFESIKVSPEVKYGLSTKFDFSGMKFNSGFNSANTLGDAGAGTMNNQKQLPYADK